MAKVAFKNITDTEFIFKDIDKEYLTECIYEYSRQIDNKELYNKVVHEKITILLNNEIVAVDDWAFNKVKTTDEIIIVPTLGDVEGGVLQVFIGAALLVASYYFPAAAPFLKAAGVGMMLGGISSMLFQPDLPRINAGNSSNQSQTYNWNGIKTAASPDMPVPIVYGTHKVGGNIISAFTEANGDDNYLYLLLALCEGEIEGICLDNNHASVCTTSDQSNAAYRHPAITMDDQPLKVYDKVNWWYRTGTNSKNATLDDFDPSAQNPIPFFDSAKMQSDDGRDISTEGIVYTTTKEVDAVNLQLYSPQLFRSDTSGIHTGTIKYKVEYKSTSDSEDSYTLAEIPKWSPAVVGNDNTNASKCTSTRYKDDLYTYGSLKPEEYTIEVVNTTFRDFDNETTIWRIGNAPIETHQIDYTIDIIIKDTYGNIVETKTINQSMSRSIEYDPGPCDGETESGEEDSETPGQSATDDDLG